MSNRTLLERFVRYARMETTSCETSRAVPSTACQMEFQKDLERELRSLGLEGVRLSDSGVLYARMPALPSARPGSPVIGLLAHVDTSPEAPGKGVEPRIHEDWDGTPIELREDVVVDPSDMRDMRRYVGGTIITSGGDTLLGADDKAGVAIIVTACEEMLADESLPRPALSLAFTPDEEIGRGVAGFELDQLGADFAYTVDGGPLGVVDSQTFNAFRCDWKIRGRQVHPGTARGVMINAVRIAGQLVSMLRGDEMPESTGGMEGFIYPLEVSASCQEASVRMIVRDFTVDGMEGRLAGLRAMGETLQRLFPGSRVTPEFVEQYRNPGEIIARDRRLVEYALEGSRRVGIDAVEGAIRGGTDGSRLSHMGLPTVNLPTGGESYHSRREWIALEGMNLALETLLGTLAVWSERT